MVRICLKLVQVLALCGFLGSGVALAADQVDPACRPEMNGIASGVSLATLTEQFKSSKDTAVELAPHLKGWFNFLDKFDLFTFDWVEHRKSKGAITYSIAAKASIKPFAELVPQVEELRQIIEEPGERTRSELKDVIERWMVKNRIDLKLVWPDDLKAIGERYKNEGLLDTATVLTRPNGYIDDLFYSLMVERGMFPMADPHDILNHLALFIFPRAVKAYKEPARIFAKLNILGQRLETAKENGQIDQNIYDHFTSAIKQTTTALDGDFRFLTFESVLFKLKRDGKTKLIFEGNHAGWLGFEVDESTYLDAKIATVERYADLLFIEGTQKQAGLFPKTMPLKREYLLESSELWKKNLRILRDIGLNRQGTFADVHRRFVSHVQKTLDDLEVTMKTANWRDDAFQNRFIDQLFSRILRDSKLDGAVDIRNRWALQRAATELYDDYLNWIFRHYGAENMLK